MDQLQHQLTEERASHAAALAEIAELRNLVAELRREVRDSRIVTSQVEQERKRSRGQEVEKEKQKATIEKTEVTTEKSDKEDKYCKILEARVPNGFMKLGYYDDTKTVQECAHSLLEIMEVDEVLLRDLPLRVTKYANTINRIRKNALILLKYRFKVPNLPILHELSKHNYLLFKREEKEGLYKLYEEAAKKLEDSLLKSIAKTTEVVKELEMISDK